MNDVEQIYNLIVQSHIPPEHKDAYWEAFVKMMESKQDNPELRQKLKQLFHMEAEIREKEIGLLKQYLQQYKEQEKKETEIIKPEMAKIVEGHETAMNKTMEEYDKGLGAISKELETFVSEGMQQHEQEDINDIRAKLGLGDKKEGEI